MQQALTTFIPPFCPRENCPSHCSSGRWTYKRAGSYVRKAAPREIPRYNCRCCGVSFSSQSFHSTYYLKRPDLLLPVFGRLVACSGFRQIARDLGVSHTTVMRLCERLGRHHLLFLWQALKNLTLKEAVVIDGFESFAYSQYHPCHFHLAVGAKSHFTYAFTDSELRRKGRMTDAQKRRRQELEEKHGRPDPKSIEKEVAELLKLLPKAEGSLVVLSDEHPAYPRALKRSGLPVRHEVTPGEAPRTRFNPLFPVNLMDGLLRHSSANHKRETIAFSKTRQNGVERLAIFAVWRNFAKWFSENHPGTTPAMAAGLAERKLAPREIVNERLFPWRIELPERWERYYRRLTSTVAQVKTRPHALRLAY